MAFINVPVADKEVSKSFYSALGFTPNPQFESDTTACIVVEENIFVLVHEPTRWREFLHSEAAPAGTTAFMVALSAGSRQECDALRAKALAHGGSPYGPAQDLGFMYGTSFRDPDGHVWEVTWMDVPAAAESGGLDQPS
nr:VOC family protein [uncultured Pseudokineococcus sp.]